MATTLIINPGSTSKKYALYRDGEELISIRFEETVQGFDVCEIVRGNSGKCEPVNAERYDNSLSVALERLVSGSYISEPADIAAVGVRVVAPGAQFAKHAVVDDQYIAALDRQEPFAPLHIPPVREALLAVRETLPKAKLVAASDSAFHITHPEYVSRYGLPVADADRLDIKRFGYHGLSVSSVASRLPDMFDGLPERVLVCHIGGGISVTSLKSGRSFDSSMGFGPMSGLMMSGRAGDLDAAAVLALVAGLRVEGTELHRYLNDQSGFVGVAGVRDMRQVLNNCNEKDERAVLAFNMFIYQFTKLVGGMSVALGGVDAVVLTATAAVRNPELRAHLLSGLAPLGIEFSKERNAALINQEGRIEKEGGQVAIGVMKTDELGEIDRIVREFI